MKFKIGSSGCYLEDNWRCTRERVTALPKSVAVAWVRESMVANRIDPSGNGSLRELADYGRWLNKLWVCVDQRLDGTFIVLYNHDGNFYLYTLVEEVAT